MNNVPILGPRPPRLSPARRPVGRRSPDPARRKTEGLPVGSARTGRTGETCGRPDGGVGRPARTDGPPNRIVIGGLILNAWVARRVAPSIRYEPDAAEGPLEPDHPRRLGRVGAKPHRRLGRG